MSFLVKVEGSESFEVAKECVRSVKVTTDIPLDSIWKLTYGSIRRADCRSLSVS